MPRHDVHPAEFFSRDQATPDDVARTEQRVQQLLNALQSGTATRVAYTSTLQPPPGHPDCFPATDGTTRRDGKAVLMVVVEADSEAFYR